LEKVKDRYPEPWQEKEVKPIRRIHPFLRVAAVVALVLVGAYYSYDNYQKAQIRPGTYGAMIITPGGNAIHLSSGAVQDIARGYKVKKAGITVVEHKNGEVEYIAKNHPLAASDKLFELLTFRGNTFILTLPNIGRIWVNASSSIWIPANLSGDTIHIKLNGEAYFDIAADKRVVIEILPTANRQLPTANRQLPTVNGQLPTFVRESGSFNVHAYSSDNLKVARDPQSIAWKNKMIYYQDASLKIILDDISRWYNVDVAYDGHLTNKKFHINLPRSAEFPEVIRVLNEQGALLGVYRKTITVL
jgi:hypothetical protein